jgi:hypothetical protein
MADDPYISGSAFKGSGFWVEKFQDLTVAWFLIAAVAAALYY